LPFNSVSAYSELASSNGARRSHSPSGTSATTNASATVDSSLTTVMDAALGPTTATPIADTTESV
jgi:hypothetical protein